MIEKVNLRQIYNLEGDDVIVIGISEVKPLAKMQDLGCIGTNKFTPINVEVADDSVKKGTILVFRKGNEIYHNVATVSSDVVLYKSLTDVAGLKCIRLENFLAKAEV